DVERLGSSRLNADQAAGNDRRRGDDLAGLDLPAQAAGLDLEGVEKTVLAADDGEIFEDRGGRRYPQSSLILPAHRSGGGIKRVEEEVLRSDQHGVSRHCGRGVDAVSRCSAPHRFARFGSEAVNLAVAAAKVKVAVS